MLDIPYASRDRTFDLYDPLDRGIPHPAAAWQPKHTLVPAWRLDARARRFKRAVDIAISMVGLALLAVVGPLLILAIRLESPGPALFRQRRVGLHGAPFTMLKFRTMRAAPAQTGALCQATRGDPRVTRLGCWLRRLSLDELPQFINVFLGDMSIVGPRPHAPGTRAGGRLFEDVTHRYAARHCVKPGMTGLAQIRGWRGETDTEDKLLRRVECDLEYIATWSPGLDFWIMLRTAGPVLCMRNAY
jgi:hypothetical protein